MTAKHPSKAKENRGQPITVPTICKKSSDSVSIPSDKENQKNPRMSWQERKDDIQIVIYNRRIPIRGFGLGFVEGILLTPLAAFLDSLDGDGSAERDDEIGGADMAAGCPVAGTLNPASTATIPVSTATLPVCGSSFPPPVSDTQFSFPTPLNRRVKSLTVLSGTSS